MWRDEGKRSGTIGDDSEHASQFHRHDLGATAMAMAMAMAMWAISR